jgi:pentatricopeptide repeat protein
MALTFTKVFDAISELIAPIWLEFMFTVFFLLGFQIALFMYAKENKGGKHFQLSPTHEQVSPTNLHEQITAHAEAGHWASILKLWHNAIKTAPASNRTLQVVVRAFLEVEPDKLIEEIIGHFISHADTHALNSYSVEVVLHVVSKAGRVDILDELASAFKNKAGIHLSSGAFEILVKGHAHVGSAERVAEIFAEAHRCHPASLMSRGHLQALRGFLKHDMVSAALHQVTEMQRKGCPLPDHFMMQVLRRACQTDHDMETIVAAVVAKAVEIPQGVIVTCLGECETRNDLQLALRIEKIALKRIEHLPLEAYHALVSVCIRHKDDHAIDLFRNMQTEDLHVTVASCICLLALCHENEFTSLSEEIVHYVCGRAGMIVTCAVQLLKDGLRKERIKGKTHKVLDTYAFRIIMMAVSMKHNTLDIAEVWNHMDTSGVDVTADDVLFDQVLDACSHHHQKIRLESVFANFMKSNSQPSVQRCVSLIKACGSLKQLDQCSKLWEKIEGAFPTGPSDAALECMIKALVSNDKVCDAVALLDKWKSRVPPTIEMYRSIIKGYAASKQAVQAMDLWKEIIIYNSESHLVLDIAIFNAMIESQASVGAMTEVGKLVASMPEYGVAPNTKTYSSIIQGYCFKASDLERAYHVFFGMQKKGCAIEVVAYKSIIDHAICNDRMDIADMVMEDLEKNIRSNALKPSALTLEIVVNMYGRRNRLDDAFQAFRDFVPRSNLEITQVRIALMCACLRNHDRDRAMKVFEEIKVTGHGRADAKTYGLVLLGLSRMGCHTEAIGIVEEAYALGSSNKRGLVDGQVLEPDELYEFVHVLCQKGVLRPLDRLLCRMYAANLPIPDQLYRETDQGIIIFLPQSD